MLKPKKKLTKHELKEDKFVKTTLQVKNYVDQNYRQVMTVVLSIFAAIVLLIVYRQLSGESEQEAQGQLGIAEIEYSNNNFDRARDRLHRLIDNYGDTREADQGRLILANIYYNQNDYENAERYFREFIDSYSGSDILMASGYAGLAACLELKKDFSTAADLYEKASKMAPDYPESDNYAFLAGLCYQKSNNDDEARRIFEDLKANAKSQKAARDAEIQLTLLAK
jgi:tetratricopeptide (TPR) repeat protein